MIATGDFVVEQWRSSKDRFVRDIWDRASIWANRRRLEPLDPRLGSSPDNVEWRFQPIKKKPAPGRKPKEVVTTPPPEKPKRPKYADARRMNQRNERLGVRLWLMSFCGGSGLLRRGNCRGELSRVASSNMVRQFAVRQAKLQPRYYGPTSHPRLPPSQERQAPGVARAQQPSVCAVWRRVVGLPS